MMKILLFILILICAAEIFAQPQTKCFRNDGLRDNHIVRFEADGGDVAGSYFVESDGDAEQTQTFDFSGTRSGNTLTVKFAGDAPPGVVPSKTKSLIWTLAHSADGEILRIKLYGKNYETNKYADYFADFKPCETNYGLLERSAKTVRFAKGKTSAKIALSFENTTEQKVFSLNVRRGQTLAIDAAGCKISVYLPDGKLYEFVEWENGDEKTFASSAIDRMTIKSLPNNGNFLVVLQKLADAAQPESVIFKITK